jgi:hypothetical protein
MALCLDIDDSVVGIGFKKAYAIIASISGDKRSIQVRILYYTNREAKIKEYQPVRYDVYSIALNDLDIDTPLFSSIYSWLKKNIPTFAQAEDC